MKSKTPLIVIGVILLFFGGLAVGRLAIAPLVQKYFVHSASAELESGPLMIATPDGDEPIDHEAGSVSGIANGAFGDTTLQTDVWNAILKAESSQNCSDVTSDDIDVTQQPDSKGAWTEEWTVKACGTVRIFKVRFTPNISNTGTSFDITG